MSSVAVRSVVWSALAVGLMLLSTGPGGAQAPAPAAPPASSSGQTVAPAAAKPPVSRRSHRVRMETVRVASPDGRLVLSMLPNAERLTYMVTMGDTPVLEPSPVVMLVDGYDLSAGVVLTGEERFEGSETYPWLGATSTAVSRYNGVRLSLTHDLSRTDYHFEVRAFDDGVAWRHVVAGQDAAVRVPDELSTFVLPAGATVWYAGMAEGHYEAPYQQKDVSVVEPGEWAGPPLTFRLPDGGYGSITEANLVDYAGMGLEADGRRGWIVGLGHRQPLNYPFELRYGRDEGYRLGKAAGVGGTITTPWRVVMAGRDLHTLVTSTILANLSPPPDPALFPEGLGTSWVRPGRAVWRYLDGGPTGVEGMKTLSEHAAALGFEYHVLEGFWSKWSMEERRDVVAHARERGVGLWFWRHSNQLRTPEARTAFFAMLRDLGVVGAKIDFMDHEAKEIIDLYEALLRSAAEHQILVNFHGANKPTGRERTWPNDMSREAVRGMESSSLMERARHQTILPFTRYLAGAADYTVVHFGERRRDSSVAHQIASMAVLASPLLTLAANPEALLASPAVHVIRSIPAVWDETIVLPDSAVGELAAFARRSGTTWVLAVMCGPAPRSLSVPLTFLGDGAYRATSVRDAGPDGATVRVERTTATRPDRLTLDLQAGGGAVVRFER